MPGYSPEEAAAFRAKLVGDSKVTEFDRKASDVSASASRLGDNQYVKGILGGVGGALPATPMLRDAVEQADLQRKGGIGGLSTATQSALARPQAPEELRALESPVPNVEAAPSLKQQMLAKLGGGGGGAGGSGLYSAFMAARKKQLGDYETDKELADEMGNRRAGHVMGMADWQHADAAKKERDAQIQQDVEAQAHAKHEALLTRNMQLADDIGKQKIDPQRLIKNQSTAGNIMHILGGALGGALAAKTGGPNQFLERFDKQVAQDIQAQMDEVDNKKASLGARQNVFAHVLQETGDRRLAAMQTRNLMYEAAKQHLAATDAQMGVPEISTAAQQQIATLQHQQDALNSQFTGEAWQMQQRQAAAAAAAQAHAADKAWQRQMDLAKLGLERDKLTVDQMKAMGLSGEDIAKQSAQLGDKLASPDLAQGRSAVENAKRRLAAAGPGEGLPGVGRGADLREKLAGRPEGIAALFPQNHLINKIAGLSDEERTSRGDWEKVKLAYRKQITGSGGSEAEMRDIMKAFEGAKTPAEQRQAIDEADSFFKQIESRHKAGYDPRAVQRYETNLANQAGIQPRGDDRGDALRKKLAGDR